MSTHYRRIGELTPAGALMLAVLEATPGVVTYHALNYLLRKPRHKDRTLRTLRSYASDIRVLAGRRLICHQGIGYALHRAAETSPAAESGIDSAAGFVST